MNALLPHPLSSISKCGCLTTARERQALTQTHVFPVQCASAFTQGTCVHHNADLSWLLQSAGVRALWAQEGGPLLVPMPATHDESQMHRPHAAQSFQKVTPAPVPHWIVMCRHRCKSPVHVPHCTRTATSLSHTPCSCAEGLQRMQCHCVIPASWGSGDPPRLSALSTPMRQM